MLAAFPVLLAGSWVRSSTVCTQTIIPVGWQHLRQPTVALTPVLDLLRGYKFLWSLYNKSCRCVVISIFNRTVRLNNITGLRSSSWFVMAGIWTQVCLSAWLRARWTHCFSLMSKSLWKGFFWEFKLWRKIQLANSDQGKTVDRLVIDCYIVHASLARHLVRHR